MYYEADRRPNVAAWTTDRGGQAAKGDLVALYAKGSMQRYVAIARVCCNPVQNRRARRRIAERDWWTYLQVQPLASSVDRSDVEQQSFARHGSGLLAPRGGQANRVADEVADDFLDLLVKDDPVATKRLTSWRPGGKGGWPRNLDLEELEWSDWAPPDARQQEEVELCRRLADRLVKSGNFRYLRSDDGVGVSTSRAAVNSVSSMSLEHRITDDAGGGRIDVLLVDTRTKRPTLVLIEAKLRARPSWNPVPQAVRYRTALEARDGARWTVKAVVAAEHFHPLVLEEAQTRGVDPHLCTRARAVLRPPL